MKTVLKIYENGCGRTSVRDDYQPRDGEIIVPDLTLAEINKVAKIEARRLFVRYGRFGYVDYLDITGATKKANLSPGISFSDEGKIGTRAKAVLSRIRRRARYLEEVAPQWQDIRSIYYADNSVAVEQVASDGRRREKLVTAPHGDVC